MPVCTFLAEKANRKTFSDFDEISYSYCIELMHQLLFLVDELSVLFQCNCLGSVETKYLLLLQ